METKKLTGILSKKVLGKFVASKPEPFLHTSKLEFSNKHQFNADISTLDFTQNLHDVLGSQCVGVSTGASCPSHHAEKKLVKGILYGFEMLPVGEARGLKSSLIRVDYLQIYQTPQMFQTSLL